MIKPQYFYTCILTLTATTAYPAAGQAAHGTLAYLVDRVEKENDTVDTYDNNDDNCLDCTLCANSCRRLTSNPCDCLKFSTYTLLDPQAYDDLLLKEITIKQELTINKCNLLTTLDPYSSIAVLNEFEHRQKDKIAKRREKRNSAPGGACPAATGALCCILSSTSSLATTPASIGALCCLPASIGLFCCVSSCQ